MQHSSIEFPWVLYQSSLLNTYSERLNHGFSGKPLSLGGQALAPQERHENRTRFCHKLDVDPRKLIVPEQVHSANIKTDQDSDFSQTDAVILTQPDVPAMLLFADCTPIILYDPLCHIGAVIHAGWRGTAQAIAQKTVEHLQTLCNSRPENILAAIGPAIGPCCYEVSEEVAEVLLKSIPVNQKVSSVIVQQSSLKPHIDLKTLNKIQLQAMGIQNIDVLPHCTRCETEHLWSHRRGEIGRQCALLALKP